MSLLTCKPICTGEHLPILSNFLHAQVCVRNTARTPRNEFDLSISSGRSAGRPGGTVKAVSEGKLTPMQRAAFRGVDVCNVRSAPTKLNKEMQRRPQLASMASAGGPNNTAALATAAWVKVLAKRSSTLRNCGSFTTPCRCRVLEVVSSSCCSCTLKNLSRSLQMRSGRRPSQKLLNKLVGISDSPASGCSKW